MSKKGDKIPRSHNPGPKRRQSITAKHKAKIQAAIRNMPNGKEFIIDGIKYKKIRGKAVRV
ncbi:MAG: hypothetical protein CL944_02590 [Candidatus Diapherotrites archaeon]|uniref:Uncharacterized protein n=1 Tax=Candidatus Iainarchaeum sp. TaxID=3101447 RepID=A0A2D6LQ82_9ARCH|nr:hypothetical protein [Candidatus Diapherotrites archaeon]|tara:strand:- start:37129 stop:37311 length:183 start_codon:yes stop_codon:yes gene_type:complete